MKKIIATLLIFLSVFGLTQTMVFANNTLAFNNVAEHIATSKKVEAKKNKVEGQIEKIKTLLKKKTDAEIKKWPSKATILQKKYENFIPALNNAVEKLESSKSIYKFIYVDAYTDLWDFMKSENQRILVFLGKIDWSTQKVSERYADIKVGTTEEEKEAIKDEVISLVKKKGTDRTELKVTLESNGYTSLESGLLTLKTTIGEDFKFCANFTADIYTFQPMREYIDAQSPMAREYFKFSREHFKNQLDNPKTNKDAARIQQCVRAMYKFQQFDSRVNQDFVKRLYEKAYGEKFNVHTKTFYDLGIQPEDIDDYIARHHSK